MKTRVIGQCKNCKYYLKEIKMCNYRFSGIFSTMITFGCWYWKERR